MSCNDPDCDRYKQMMEDAAMKLKKENEQLRELLAEAQNWMGVDPTSEEATKINRLNGRISAMRDRIFAFLKDRKDG